VNNAAAIMGQYQKDVQDLEADGGDGKEVDGNQLRDVVLQERTPSLRRRLRPRTMYLLTLVSPIAMPSLSSSP